MEHSSPPRPVHLPSYGSSHGLSDGSSEAEGMDLEEPEADGQGPVGTRKLRNGKVRVEYIAIDSDTIVDDDHDNDVAANVNADADVDVDVHVDVGEAGDGDETIRPTTDPHSPSRTRGLTRTRTRSRSRDGSKPPSKPSASAEATMRDSPTTPSLSRLLKADLLCLCAERGLDVLPEHKKAELVAALVEWGESHAAPPTARPGDAPPPPPDDEQQPPTARAPQVAVDNDDDNDNTNNDKNNNNNKEEEEGAPLDLEALKLVDRQIDPRRLHKGSKIGSGGFKDVYRGTYDLGAGGAKTAKRARKMPVAIAELRGQLTEMDIKELEVLRDLSHENICRFIGVSVDPNTDVPCTIVSELCTNGDLYEYIRHVPAPPDVEMLRIMLMTAQGLDYLHTRKPAIIHRDIKSSNVLITAQGVAKINDFGLARVRHDKRRMVRSVVGTVNWQAMELWHPKPLYNEKVDVWSSAMTFWEILQWPQKDKRYPFQSLNEHQIYRDVRDKGIRPPTANLRRRFGGDIIDLIESMWVATPRERPSMALVCDRLRQLILEREEQQDRD